jgi:hypothetical protein
VIATEPVILITKEPNAECRARTFSAPAAGRWRDTIEAHSFSDEKLNMELCRALSG